MRGCIVDGFRTIGIDRAGELCDGLEDRLTAIAHLYEEGGGRANAEWERFRVSDAGEQANLLTLIDRSL